MVLSGQMPLPELVMGWVAIDAVFGRKTLPILIIESISDDSLLRIPFSAFATTDPLCAD